MKNMQEVRQFIRHPAEIPIEVSPGSQGRAFRSRNLGMGGLAFHAAHPIKSGSVVEIRIRLVRPLFKTRARVAWCQASASGFDLGVEFLDAEDAFRARMVEQVCHIEQYRKAVQQTEDRALTAEEAASEWIDKYAAQFPDPGPGSTH